jgi:hypothetical protein
MQDSCVHVRRQFAAKLDKYLGTFKLPLQYLPILVLGTNDPDQAQQEKVLLAFISIYLVPSFTH